MKRAIAKLCLGLGAGALLGASAFAQDIKIGAIYDLTGPFAGGGSKAASIGTKIAIDIINERGGVEGHKIVGIFVDAQSKIDVAINEAERLLNEQKVDILMGVYSSAQCVPMSAKVDAAKKFLWMNVCISSAVFKDKNLPEPTLTGAKSVVHVHVAWSHGYSTAAKLGVRHADAVFSISRFVTDTVLATGTPSERVYTILNCVDPSNWDSHIDGSGVRREFGIPPKAPLLASVSRLFGQKGQRELLQAFARVRVQIADAVANQLGVFAFHPGAGFAVGDRDRKGGILEAGKGSTPQPVFVLLSTNFLLEIIAELIPIIHRIYAPIAGIFHKVFHIYKGPLGGLFQGTRQQGSR